MDIFLVVGDQNDFEPLEKQIETFARDQGVTFMRVYARKGFEYLIDRRSWKFRQGLEARPARLHQAARHALGGGTHGRWRRRQKPDTIERQLSRSRRSSYRPGWTRPLARRTVAEAGRIAALPYQPYEGTLIPEFSQMTADTLQYMLDNAGSYQGHVRRGRQRHAGADGARRRPARQSL